MFVTHDVRATKAAIKSPEDFAFDDRPTGPRTTIAREAAESDLSCDRNTVSPSLRTCPDGGTGRRTHLAGARSQERAGSNPAPGTASTNRYKYRLIRHAIPTTLKTPARCMPEKCPPLCDGRSVFSATCSPYCTTRLTHENPEKNPFRSTGGTLLRPTSSPTFAPVVLPGMLHSAR